MYEGNKNYDASWRDPYFERAFEQLGGDERAAGIVDALKTMYTMYTDDLIKWYANLYDPYYGAFYCTTSGKENDGFLPDIESTMQALDFLERSGMINHLDRDYRKVLTDEQKAKIVRFIKSMQLPNGYFYNLIMDQEVLDKYISRRGRDLSWCTNFLRELGASPTYDTPNGMKGDGLDKDGKPVADYVSKFAEAKTEEGADKPASCAAALNNYPDYLENRETLLAWLEEKVPIKTGSYGAGNLLNAVFREIKARSDALIGAGADYSLCDTLINWLNERIDENTGYWSDKPTFAGTNGYFKTITLYNVWGYAYPEPVKVTKSILNGILGDEPSTTNICEVFNLWMALCFTIGNVKSFHSPEVRDAVLNEINEVMYNRGRDAILNTYKKQSAYQMPDGAFAHRVDRCLLWHQGDIPVGTGGQEGDVDAISKACMGITDTIATALGIKPIPLYSEREFKIYMDILNNAKPVIKPNTKLKR
ncbi:MAG: hypothetical protein J6Q85_00810 [Clostridia bacterium]|nr:hypothetical protein [Clostridia bacterium]